MSRITGDVQITPNPAVKFVQWLNPGESNQDKGVKDPGFYYWDKEKETNVSVGFPFIFQYLEDAIGISGFLKSRKKFIHSNEVLDVYETPLDIKIWNDGGEEVLKSGFFYTDQKEPKSEMAEVDFKAMKTQIQKDGKNGVLQTLPKLVSGAKKCKILYILVGEEIWRMRLDGSKLVAWDEFQKEQNPNKYKGIDNNVSNFIAWYETELKENTMGGEDYNCPKFKYMKSKDEDDQKAKQVYEEMVKPYFKYILDKPKETATVDYQD